MVLIWKMEVSRKSSNLVSERVKILMGIKRELCAYFLRGHGNNQVCRFCENLLFYFSFVEESAVYIRRGVGTYQMLA